MGEYHPLGMSGRARGVEQAGQGAGVEVQGCEAVRGGGQDHVEGIRAGGGLAAGQEDVPATQAVPDRPERGPAVGIGDQHPGARVGDDVADLLRLQRGIHDVRDGPGPQGAQVADEQLEAAVQEDRDDLAPARPEARQGTGGAVGEAVEFLIGEGAVFEAERGVMGPILRRLGQQMGNVHGPLPWRRIPDPVPPFSLAVRR